MADRKSLFSRFWPASASRRTQTQTIAPPPASPSPNRRPTQPTTPTPTAEQPNSTTSEPRKSPSTQTQTSSTKTSPSRGPSKPVSPNRQAAKSRSPPPAPQTPKRASSPKVGSSTSKRTQPKESTQEISSREPAELNAKDHRPNRNNLDDSVVGDVKEVVQATTIEAADEETKKQKSGSQDHIIEKTEIPTKPPSDDHNIPSKPLSQDNNKIIEKTAIPCSKQDEVQKEPHCTKETLPAGNTKNAQPKITASKISSTPSNARLANKMAIGDAVSDKPASVITLAGENRGAFMQMESRDEAVHIRRSYKTNPDETADGKNSEDASSTETYVNNNSQGINNSIVFNSSIAEGSPGVHMLLTCLPKESIPETRRAEFNPTRTDKLTYQPTVRRRCLKGLFLETSDSEDPERPRRHGCRVG